MSLIKRALNRPLSLIAQGCFFDLNKGLIMDQPDLYDCFLTPSGTLGSKTSVSINQTYLGEFDDSDLAEDAIRAWIETNGFYPNIWYVSDHGNITHYRLED